MNRRNVILLTGAIAIAVFAAGAFLYSRYASDPANLPVLAENSPLVRPHSPTMGPASAGVTIVEFFDPACESCRAFYPFVKSILAEHPDDVRLVLRYTAFHPTSEDGIRVLEAARKQDKFQAVLEALLEKQQEWSGHHAPDAARAWQIGGDVGLDRAKARQDGTSPEVDAVLTQDMADVRAMEIKSTPTFFVNGKRLTSFGPDQLAELVRSEVTAQD